jgi:hypothetical protein
MAGEFDIRFACRNRVNYLRGTVDMLKHSYPDVDVVDSGTELGPCTYQTVFKMSVSNPEDNKEVALAVARINEFISDLKARLGTYGWVVFEKEAKIEGDLYMDVRWIKKIRLPGRRYTTPMDIYELALPYIEASLRAAAKLSEALAEA